MSVSLWILLFFAERIYLQTSVTCVELCRMVINLCTPNMR